jgi:hypothetical protein
MGPLQTCVASAIPAGNVVVFQPAGNALIPQISAGFSVETQRMMRDRLKPVLRFEE